MCMGAPTAYQCDVYIDFTKILPFLRPCDLHKGATYSPENTVIVLLAQRPQAVPFLNFIQLLLVGSLTLSISGGIDSAYCVYTLARCLRMVGFLGIFWKHGIIPPWYCLVLLQFGLSHAWEVSFCKYWWRSKCGKLCLVFVVFICQSFDFCWALNHTAFFVELP